MSGQGTGRYGALRGITGSGVSMGFRPPLPAPPLDKYRLRYWANRQNLTRTYFDDPGGFWDRDREAPNIYQPLMMPPEHTDLGPFGEAGAFGSSRPTMGQSSGTYFHRAMAGLGQVKAELSLYGARQSARAASAALAGRTLGCSLGALVTPASVSAQIATIDAAMQQTARDANACSLDASTAQAWNTFFQSWQKFSSSDVNLLNAGSMADQADGFETTLGQWQTRLANAGCTISSQPLPPPAESGLAAAANAVPKLVIAGVVIAGAWVLIEGMRTARAFRSPSRYR